MKLRIRPQNFNSHRLSYRGLFWIMISSSILTLAATGAQMHEEFKGDVAAIEQRMNQIEKSYLPGIENSLWTFDEAQLEIQIRGIINLPDIAGVEVLGDDGTHIGAGSLSFPDQAPLIMRSYHLTHKTMREVAHIGSLKVVATKERVYQRLWNKIIVFLVTNSAKTFPLSFVILFILSRLVTRHLEQMASYARGLDLDHLDRPLVLKKKSKKARSQDELDEVANAINEMRESLLNGITEIKRAEKERLELLDHVQALVVRRDEFISIAAHELRTPITAMHLQLQLINMGSDKDQGRNDSRPLQLLSRQVERLMQLVETLFSASSCANKGIELNFREVSLSKLIEDIIERLIPLIRNESCTLHDQIEADVIGNFDWTRIEEVLVNLITNAVKFGRGKPIEISLTKSGDFATIVIRDHGIGIKKEEQVRIFDKFERAVSIKSFGGLGLGLYVARQIIEAHGGKIKIDSEPGKGASFSVQFPLKMNVGEKLVNHLTG